MKLLILPAITATSFLADAEASSEAKQDSHQGWVAKKRPNAIQIA